ncbi:MAG: hypothetical protein GY870_06930, partial [archaeon]|nr:hypothetical protein [archaeon]
MKNKNTLLALLLICIALNLNLAIVTASPLISILMIANFNTTNGERIEMSENGKYLIATGERTGDDYNLLYSIPDSFDGNSEPLRNITQNVGSTPADISISNDGSKFLIVNPDNDNLYSYSYTSTIPSWSESAMAVRLGKMSANREYVLYWDYGSNMLTLLNNSNNGQEIWSYEFSTFSITSLDICDDGSFFTVGFDNGTIFGFANFLG